MEEKSSNEVKKYTKLLMEHKEVIMENDATKADVQTFLRKLGIMGGVETNGNTDEVHNPDVGIGVTLGATNIGQDEMKTNENANGNTDWSEYEENAEKEPKTADVVGEADLDSNGRSDLEFGIIDEGK